MRRAPSAATLIEENDSVAVRVEITAAIALTRDILPTVRSASGFVAGYWLEPVDGRGFSFVVFETEEEARRSAPPAGNWAVPGVSINEVDVRRVAASA